MQGRSDSAAVRKARIIMRRCRCSRRKCRIDITFGKRAHERWHGVLRKDGSDAASYAFTSPYSWSCKCRQSRNALAPAPDALAILVAARLEHPAGRGTNGNRNHYSVLRALLGSEEEEGEEEEERERRERWRWRWRTKRVTVTAATGAGEEGGMRAADNEWLACRPFVRRNVEIPAG